jgi:hypothetical protein
MIQMAAAFSCTNRAFDESGAEILRALDIVAIPIVRYDYRSWGGLSWRRFLGRDEFCYQLVSAFFQNNSPSAEHG